MAYWTTTWETNSSVTWDLGNFLLLPNQNSELTRHDNRFVLRYNNNMSHNISVYWLANILVSIVVTVPVVHLTDH